jgi:hypothetical protein
MGKRTPILFVVVLAMAIAPLRLPAASCILSNAPSPDGCRPNCCANKTCCAVSKKNTTPVSQPLYKSGDLSQHPVIGFVSVPVIDSIAEVAFTQLARRSISVRAHSPPPLAASCICLI